MRLAIAAFLVSIAGQVQATVLEKQKLACHTAQDVFNIHDIYIKEVAGEAGEGFSYYTLQKKLADKTCVYVFKGTDVAVQNETISSGVEIDCIRSVAMAECMWVIP